MYMCVCVAVVYPFGATLLDFPATFSMSLRTALVVRNRGGSASFSCSALHSEVGSQASLPQVGKVGGPSVSSALGSIFGVHAMEQQCKRICVGRAGSPSFLQSFVVGCLQPTIVLHEVGVASAAPSGLTSALSCQGWRCPCPSVGYCATMVRNAVHNAWVRMHCVSIFRSVRGIPCAPAWSPRLSLRHV